MTRRIAIALALTIVVSALVLSAAGKPPSGSALGAGTVFLPNPVADLGDETLTDQKDADYPALAPAYHDVVLTHLDGSGLLVGDWAQVFSETGDPAYSVSNKFRYRRDDDRFEQERSSTSPGRRCAISRQQRWRPPTRCTDAPSPRRSALASSTADC